jgi:hypothetical protein
LAKWDSYKKGQSEEEEAFATVKELTQEETKEPVTSLYKGGGKRRKEYGSSDRPPFPGCSKEDSDTLRHLVGLKYAGYTMKEAFEEVGLAPGSGSGFIATRQDAYNMADHELMEVALRGYQSNLWIMRTALSELGPRAVRTLAEIMDNKKESGPTRLKASLAILKMVDVDHSATGGAQEGLAKELADGIRNALKDVGSGKIIDAEDAETIEDGNDGTCAAVQ